MEVNQKKRKREYVNQKGCSAIVGTRCLFVAQVLSAVKNSASNTLSKFQIAIFYGITKISSGRVEYRKLILH
jgi:hypothetical protein